MESPSRQKLPHEVPLWIDPQQEIYFITANCENRGINQLAIPDVAARVLESVRFRQEMCLWWPHVFLLMPDHVHGLFSFPPSSQPMARVVSKWKEWTANNIGIEWQKNYFEHRLRSDESRVEKANYILNNPVRKGLVSRFEDWGFIYFAEGVRPKSFGGS